MNGAEYREAWAWAHFLLHGPPEARTILLGYLAQLRHDAHPPPLTPQLQQVFASLDDVMHKHIAQLDHSAQASRR